MAHKAQMNWCNWLKKNYLQYFKDVKVLDIGSLDVNGNIKHLFEDSEYIGVDVIEGKNVDVVSIAHELTFEPESFDVVCSCNAFEHDMFYPKTIKKMLELLKPKGMIFFTCANSYPEHGTKTHKIHDSGTTKMGDDNWAKYYKNLNQDDILDIISIDDFVWYNISVVETSKSSDTKDLRFVGIKK